MVMAPTPNPSSRCGFRQKYRTPAAPHGQRSHLQLAHPVSNLLRSTGSPASYRKCNLNFQPHRTPTTRCGKAYPVSNVFKFSHRKLQTLCCFLVVYVQQARYIRNVLVNIDIRKLRQIGCCLYSHVEQKQKKWKKHQAIVKARSFLLKYAQPEDAFGIIINWWLICFLSTVIIYLRKDSRTTQI